LVAICAEVAVGLMCALTATTTTASAATFTYDAPTIVRSDVNAFVDVEALTDQVSRGRDDSASPLAQVQGRSMTPLARSVATNTAADDLAAAASRAQGVVGPGKGPVYGTKVHSAFESEIAALGRSDVFTEVSYLNGQVVPRGTPGSVRLDAVVGSPGAPTAIYDLKTGSAVLTPARVAQIQSHLPSGFQNVPVLELRP